MASTLITIPRGDEKTFVFSLYLYENSTRRPLTTLELTDMVFRFTVKRRFTDADADAVFQVSSDGTSPGIVVDTGTSKAVVTIPKASTEAAKADGEQFHYDLRMFDTENTPHTFVSDVLEVVPNVTRIGVTP